MRNALKPLLLLSGVTLLGACHAQDRSDQNVAIVINDADPVDIETVPADETANPDANPENTDANAS